MKSLNIEINSLKVGHYDNNNVINGTSFDQNSIPGTAVVQRLHDLENSFASKGMSTVFAINKEHRKYTKDFYYIYDYGKTKISQNF